MTEDNTPGTEEHTRVRPFAKGMSRGLLWFFLISLGAVCLTLAGFQIDAWNPLVGFYIMHMGVVFYMAAFVVALAVVLIGLALRRRSAGAVLLVLALGLVFIPPPFGYWLSHRAPIHDISTDMSDPPSFVAIRQLRICAPTKTDYEGERIATIQRAAFPDIGPLYVGADAAKVLEVAAELARDKGWDIVALAPGEGRLEASHTSMLMRFTDDMVIRARREGEKTRVDMRSASRISGMDDGDLGANARRVRSFMAELKERLTFQ
jgi:uncharacterized protein (DUF1499 family)